jgi:hypothetical protein
LTFYAKNYAKYSCKDYKKTQLLKNYLCRVRDHTDELVQVLSRNADLEEINKSSSEGLEEFSKTYSEIADNR